MDSRVVKKTPPSHGGTRAIRGAIMALVVVVLLGYLLLWIMAPTSLYRQTWLPKIRADTNSTYFGNQGANMLLFTFPVLFIAVLGCLYHHLGKKLGDNNTERKNDGVVELWKRPILIMKGLGIVSRIELAFLAMFIGLLVWSFSTYLYVGFAKITPQSAAKSGEKVWESKLDSAALRLGLLGNLVLTLLFFPVSRGSSVLPLFGLTSEASVKYHIWLGHTVMTLFTAHGVCYFIYWAVTHQLSEMLKWDKVGVSNVAGELALVAGLVLWVTTHPRIRRKMFELFFYTHYLYILFIFFFILHVGMSYSCMMLPGFYLFVVDRSLRFLQSRKRVRLVSARVLPCETIELNFSKTQGLRYTPTSIVFINVPSISKVQWHPFTVSSNSGLEAEKLSVIIKCEGHWTHKLYQILSSPSSIDRLNVSIEGPYGPVSTNFLRHDTIVLVSGGSGITPFISIIKELIFMSETLKCKTPQIHLISSFKNSSDLTMLDLLLPIPTTSSESPNFELQIEAYVTREKQPNSENRKQLRTVWFKPNPSDAPVAPVLGQNNWLWLAAIISTSFIIFLLLLGILTRYYIYPIDHNTGKIYSSSSQAVLQMLLICVSIAITTLLVFLRNGKRNAMETKQIQNMEGATPVASPNSLFYNADRELESCPQESLALSTNVQYGERPDLKKILFEHKEGSVGVLACGPKKMRHEAAAICSSGLADNLHFESISFSW